MSLKFHLFISRALILSMVCNLVSPSVWSDSSQSHNVLSLLDTYNVTDPQVQMTITGAWDEPGYQLSFIASDATASFGPSDIYLVGGSMASSSFSCDDCDADGFGRYFSATVLPTESNARLVVRVPASGFKVGKGNNTEALQWTNALAIIQRYSNDQSFAAPEVVDYVDVGVQGVTDDNIDQVNQAVVDVHQTNLTVAILQTLVDAINQIPELITLTIPEDITVTATGYLTAVDLDPNDIASAVDGDGNSLAISIDQTGPFLSGTHEIVWLVSDGSRTVSEIQRVKVIPLVTVAAATTAEEGASITVDFLLSGDAADYPVTIPFSISGTAVQGEDYSIDAGDTVSFDEGTVGRFTLNLMVDEELEGQETIEISLGEPTNAVAGLPQQLVITIVEENVAPQLSFVVSQSNASGEVVIGTTVAADGGDVRVTPVIEDPNLNDTHVVNWSDALSSLPSALVDSETQSLSFSAATMLGVYSLTATVTDTGNPPYDVSDTVSVNVIASAPVLADDEDTDGDGISDSEEGMGDSDGDNVPDYVDIVSESHILVVNNNNHTFLMSNPGIQLSLGAFSLAEGDYDASVSENFLISQGVTADMGYDYPVDLVDFVASGAESGHSYPIVYSLGENVIPENATYRKYMGDNLGWQYFVEDSSNEVRSTYAEQGACPAASADNYSAGLVAGHNCVFMSIEDGGPNDVDGEANGTLVDPGGVAVKYIGVPSENSQIVLDKYTLVANGTDTTTITVWAYDDQQLPLQHMQVTASVDIPGVTVSDFTDRGDGRYTATITTGNISGNGPVQVVIDNGDIAVALPSDTLTLTAVPVVKSYGGGCVIANGSAFDPTLVLVLIMLALTLIKRRFRLRNVLSEK